MPSDDRQALSADEKISPMSVTVGVGVTHMVDGDWDVCAITKRNLFAGA
jgi:hypothetical protein